MAAGALPSPGTDYGPCKEPCEHRDCGATREMAAAICGPCGEPIGYENYFYRVDVPIDVPHTKGAHIEGATVLADTAGRLHELRHSRCME